LCQVIESQLFTGGFGYWYESLSLHCVVQAPCFQYSETVTYL
jgi:hypothetical protein